MGDLERDTRLVGSDGRYTATLSRDWEIWHPNGGDLASCALRAAGAAGGLMGTSGSVFAASGRLVASGGAQLFCVPRPPDA